MAAAFFGFHALLSWLLLVLVVPYCSSASDEFPRIHHCSSEEGGGVCPEGNTCCRIVISNAAATSSGCIPSDLGANHATCCDDGRTGCGVGYRCSSTTKQCIATSSQDPLAQVLPRYPLCTRGEFSDFSQIHGLWIPIPTSGRKRKRQLLYYSSHGDLENLLLDPQDIRRVLVVVHGANRNADDYFCTATAAVARFQRHQVLVLAPRFAVPKDVPKALQNSTLLWENRRNGPWRYGANALHTHNVSSFAAMDQLVEQVLQTTLSPSTKVVVMGHSSGGQFVQRWALLSPWAQHVRSVVANPSSYAYLTPQRYQDGEWRVPTTLRCPRYNTWEWGSDTNSSDDTTPEYVQSVLNEFRDDANSKNPYHKLIRRFAKQDVVYLAGSLDRCNVSSSSGSWCESHGLETTCADELQGTNRWERHERYVAMLRRVGVTKHQQVVVAGVGHDHGLMIHSPEGLQVLFGQKKEDARRQGWVVHKGN